jgi:hypothetical protein
VGERNLPGALPGNDVNKEQAIQKAQTLLTQPDPQGFFCVVFNKDGKMAFSYMLNVVTTCHAKRVLEFLLEQQLTVPFGEKDG